MNRVATGNNYGVILADLMRAQTRQFEAQEQVSSGKAADDLKGYAKDAETLMAARSLQTRMAGFIEQGQTLASKLEVQALALGQIEEAAGGARQALQEAIANGRGEGLMSQLSSLFGTASDALNTRFAGRYLFAGAQVDTAPVAAQTLEELTAAPALADVFANDALVPAARLDETTSIETGFLADQIGTGLFAAFRQMQAFVEANGDFSGELTAAQTAFLEGMVDDFEGARADLTNVTVRNGLTQNRVDKTLQTHGERKDMLDGMISDIAHVDMADALTRLQQAQTAVQASAQVFMALQGSSLLNLLK